MASNSPHENEQLSESQKTNYTTNRTLDEIVDDLNSFKDKNDNLELEVLTDEKVCRTCFNLLESESYFPVINSTTNLGYLEKLINMCLPRINLLLTKDPVVCQECFKKLEEFYTFSEACLKRETQLSDYCASNQISNPIDICDFLKHSVQETPGFVEVKQELHANTEHHCSAEPDYFETPSDDVEVKSETEIKDFQPDQSSPVRKVRKVRKTITKKPRFRVGKKHFSSDLIEAEIKCETCGQKFRSKWALDRHLPIHNTENTIYSCESCNMKFKYKHSYEKHITAHLTGALITKPFACECGKVFNRKSKLKKHQEIHVKKEKPFGCKDCGKRFIDEKSLNSHVERVHMSEKAFSCELCGNKYTSKAGLDVHFKSHFPSDKPRPEPVLMCDICGKLFYRKYSLEKHHMSHTGNKPHECDQCNMKFKERYQLTIHMRRHTGEKPFKCEVCDFKFPSKNRLGVHMRIHTGVRPFSCQICDMAFTRNDHLIKHVRAIHTGERPFECDVCSKTFNRKDYLLKHKRVHFKKGL